MLKEPVEVFTDPRPKRLDPWANAKRAWKAAEGDYHLVLENDILPCKDFLAGARKAIAAKHGVTCIRFYSCWNVMYEAIPFEDAAEKGRHWVELKVWGGAQAVALRKDAIKDLLKFESSSDHPDNRICAWLNVREETTWNTIPSLVQHAPVESIKGNTWHEANQFIGVDKSALEIDWNA